jgi:hypothetical protein
MNVQGAVEEVYINDNPLSVSHKVSSGQTLKIGTDKAILRFSTEQPELTEDADLVVNNLNRNLVCIDSQGKILWRVEEAPHDPPNARYEQGKVYDKMFDIAGEIWARNRNGRIYHIDDENGTIQQSVPNNVLPIGKERINVKLRIDTVLNYNQSVLVLVLPFETKEPTDYDDRSIPLRGRNIRSYNQDGEINWEIEPLDEDSEASSGWYHYMNFRESEFWASSYIRRYIVNPDTGKILEEYIRR